MDLQRIWRAVDDPDEVVLLFEVDDLEKAREFAYSADVPDAQHATGVVDEPDIFFLE